MAGKVGQKQGFTCMPHTCDPLGKSSMRQFKIECGSVCCSEFEGRMKFEMLHRLRQLALQRIS